MTHPDFSGTDRLADLRRVRHALADKKLAVKASWRSPVLAATTQALAEEVRALDLLTMAVAEALWNEVRRERS